MFKDALSWIVIQVWSLIEFVVRSIALFLNDRLQFVMSEDFVVWPYTTTENPVIEAGLSVTVSLVNIIIVFALVVIAGGIMLGIEKYGTKKMLLHLVLIALLVNFAPLIVGVVVDAANIAMYFFIDEAQQSMNYIADSMNKAPDTASELRQQEQFKQDTMAQLAVLTMQTFVWLVMGFIFFLYMLLFIFRYIAIWMLTILSPIAFASLAHPLLKEWWSKWWSQLIGWSFVGVFAGFFLWLSLKVNESIAGLYMSGVATSSGTGFSSTVTAYLFPMFVVASFFVIGFILSIKTSAIGADKIVNFANQRRQWLQKQAYRPVEKTRDYGKEKGKDYARRSSSFVLNRQPVKSGADWLAGMERWGEGENTFAGWAKRRASVVQKPFRAAGRKTKSTIDKNEKEIISNYQEKYGEIEDASELASLYKGSGNEKERYSLYKQAREKGKLGDFMEKTGSTFSDDFEKLYAISEKIGDGKNIREALPMEYIEKLRKDGSSDEKIKEESQEITKSLSSDPEKLKAAAKSIAKKAKEGDKAAHTMITSLMKRRVESLNTIIKSGADGMDAIDATFESFYRENKSIIDRQYGSNLTVPRRNYAVMQQISPRATKVISRGPTQLLLDIEEPEENKEEVDQNKTAVPGEASWKRRYKK